MFSFFYRRVTMYFLWELIEVLKEDTDEFIALNIDVSDLESQSACKYSDVLCIYGGTVEPKSTYICLYTGWLIWNMKTCYMWYEVASDKFCCRKVTGLGSVNYNFSVSCCYFELIEQMNATFNTFLKYVFEVGYVAPDNILIILMFILATKYTTVRNGMCKCIQLKLINQINTIG